MMAPSAKCAPAMIATAKSDSDCIMLKFSATSVPR